MMREKTSPGAGHSPEHTRASEALTLSEERFRLMVDSVIDYAIFMLDHDGRVASWNAGAERLKGYTASEIIGQHFSVFYPAEALDRGWPAHELSVAKATGRFEDEGLRVRKDGTTFWANVVITALFGPDGELRGFAKVTRDLTERKRGELELRDAHASLERRVEQRTRELEEANATLRRLDQQKNEFLATLAHELRNPLSPIWSGVELLKLSEGKEMPDVPVHRVVAMLERQVMHLTRLVDDLIDVARATRKRLELKRERVDLLGPIRHAVEASSRSIEERAHRLVVEAPAGPILLEGDSVRLSQVFANLLNNAARYTPERGAIGVRVEIEPGAAVVRVIDSGIGIASEDLDRVFEMFTQAEKSGGLKNAGLGIGLSLAKEIVELHGGTIVAKSAGLGQGSEFIVRLPIVAAVAGPSASEPTATRAAGPSRRILVVDDHQDARESVSALLTALQHDVASADEGRTALHIAEAFRPDVILLDIGMPNLSGYDTARLIRQCDWGRSAVLIAVTGWGQEEDKQRAAEAGFDYHMTKPFDAAELDRLLRASRSESDNRA
jgi:PAS domain S-box-containing protein